MNFLANPILWSEFKSMHVLVLGSVIANSLQPLDCSLPRSSVHGIFQARILEWVATSSSKGSPWSPPGIKRTSPTLQVGSLPLSHQGSPCMCLKKFSCNSSEKYSVTHTLSSCSCPLLSHALCSTNKCLCLPVHRYTQSQENSSLRKRKERFGTKKGFAAVAKNAHFLSRYWLEEGKSITSLPLTLLYHEFWRMFWKE